jgi:hypothetical protein
MTLHPGNPMRVVLLSVLLFQVIVFGLAIPVMILVSGVPAMSASVFAGGAALLALVAAGLLRKPIGYPLGWLTQLVGVALGLLTPTMFLVGAIFLALWVLSFVLGKRLDANAPAANVG